MQLDIERSARTVADDVTDIMEDLGLPVSIFNFADNQPSQAELVLNKRALNFSEQAEKQSGVYIDFLEQRAALISSMATMLCSDNCMLGSSANQPDFTSTFEFGSNHRSDDGHGHNIEVRHEDEDDDDEDGSSSSKKRRAKIFGRLLLAKHHR